MSIIQTFNRVKIIAFTCTLLSLNAFSHERFIVPSHTMLSGEAGQQVSFIASISNAIFHPDRPYGDSDTGANVGDLKPLFDILHTSIIAPDGKTETKMKWQAFARMSVADAKLNSVGTYRIGLVQPDVHMTTFQRKDGTPARIFGEKPTLPSGASNIVRRTTSSRVETYVSLNSLTRQVVKPVGSGLEISGNSHPNDLFAGEPIDLQLFYDGKPLTMAGSVKVIKSGTRHRNDREERLISIDKQGKFSFTVKEAGFYFISAETKVEVKQPANVDVKHYSAYLTLEVFPE